MQTGENTRKELLRTIGRQVLIKLHSVTKRLRDGIHETLVDDLVMSINRMVAGCTMLIIMNLLGDHMLLSHWAFPVVIWTGCALGVTLSLQFGTNYKSQRRSFAVVLDVAGTTIMLAAGGEETAFLYAVYLWIIIGNGFRFGGAFLLAASLLSIVGFSTIVLMNQFWWDHLSLSTGLLIGLAVLPAYSFGLMRQLAHARRRAEQADAAKSLFLAGVSHELRTPLHAIIGTVEMLQETQLDAGQAEMLATINTAADGQLSLVQDVMEFSRIEAGYGQAAAGSFDLLELLAKVTSVIAVTGRRKGLLVNFYMTARTPLRLWGVERYIREVLLNLGGNAVKFTSTGSVTIAADGFDIGGMVRLRLEVMDTGIGVAPESQERIFSLFTQADKAIFNRFGGTGLGLALCERQVRLMNGTIGIDSVPGAGSTFWLSLDLPNAEDQGLQPLLHPSLAPANGAGWVRSLQERLAPLGNPVPASVHIASMERGGYGQLPTQIDDLIEVGFDLTPALPRRKVRERFATSVSQHSSLDDLHRAIRIAVSHSTVRCDDTVRAGPSALSQASGRLVGVQALVADDNALNRSVLSRMLERAGLRVVLANDGEEALTLLTRGDIDLAFIDVNMPVMDGIEVAQLYAFTSSSNRHTPLIGLTADVSKETQARCLQAGMKKCLVKPVRLAELVKVAEDVLTDRAPASTPSLGSDMVPDNNFGVVPAIDFQTLASLEDLGGLEFLAQLLSDFRSDGFSLVEMLGVAQAVKDVQNFRFHAHSLSSISANIGAKKLRALCLPWSKISDDTLRQNGDALIIDLHQEWKQICRELDRFSTDTLPVPTSDDKGQRFG